MVDDKATPRLGGPNSRSKMPRLISSRRDGRVTSRAWRVIKSQWRDMRESARRLVAHDKSRSRAFQRARGSYLTVFPRRSRPEIFRPAVAMNTRCILALYSQIAISRRSRRSCIIARCTRDMMHANTIVACRISCSPARIAG